MGPIVPHEMRAYRSELLMTTPPRQAHGTASLPSSNSMSISNGLGRNAARKIAAAAGATKKLRSKVDASPPEEVVTLDHCIQVAAIAQSRIATSGKEQARRIEGILSNHRQRVRDMKSLISNTRFLISITEASDPNRKMYIDDFKKMNADLALLMSEATIAEDEIISNNANELLVKNQEHNNFIDLTIAAVVADTRDDHDDDGGCLQANKKAKYHHNNRRPATCTAALKGTTSTNSVRGTPSPPPLSSEACVPSCPGNNKAVNNSAETSGSFSVHIFEE